MPHRLNVRGAIKQTMKAQNNLAEYLQMFPVKWLQVTDTGKVFDGFMQCRAKFKSFTEAQEALQAHGFNQTAVNDNWHDMERA